MQLSGSSRKPTLVYTIKAKASQRPFSWLLSIWTSLAFFIQNRRESVSNFQLSFMRLYMQRKSNYLCPLACPEMTANSNQDIARKDENSMMRTVPQSLIFSSYLTKSIIPFFKETFKPLFQRPWSGTHWHARHLLPPCLFFSVHRMHQF